MPLIYRELKVVRRVARASDVIIRADVAQVLPRLAAPFLPPMPLIEPPAESLDVAALGKKPSHGDVSISG